MSTPENPYAAPTVTDFVQPVEVEQADAERIRKQYLSHEASVRSIGSLYLLGAAALLILGPVLLFGGLRDTNYPSWLGLALMFLGALNVVLGIGLRQLRPWVRIPVALLSGLGLLQFGLGTLISAYIMYLVLCQKGKMVLSNEYAEIVRQTPHIKYRTSMIVKVLLVIVLALIAIAVVGAFLSRGR